MSKTNLDINCILNVSTQEKIIGLKRKIGIINSKGRLANEEIERIVQDAKRYKTEDDDHMKKIPDTKKIGEEYSVDITITGGRIGRDALIYKNLKRFIYLFSLVKWRDNSIVLIVGYVPGLKVHAISLHQSVIRVTTLAVKQEF
ncbi:heat shock 70 kDa protein-like [Castanea sativa]|uniref:heat shock 70 kDa protein-like n=1 Tax=Castanea sativa TaxID=21020 RepID=UPI003F649ED2